MIGIEYFIQWSIEIANCRFGTQYSERCELRDIISRDKWHFRIFQKAGIRWRERMSRQIECKSIDQPSFPLVFFPFVWKRRVPAWHRGGWRAEEIVDNGVGFRDGWKKRGKGRKKGERTRTTETLLPPAPGKIVADGTDRKLFRAFRGLSESRTPFTCSHPSAIPPSATRDLLPPRRRRNANGKEWKSMVPLAWFSLHLSLSLSLCFSHCFVLHLP